MPYQRKSLAMPDCFEILHKDLAGRIGRLRTPHGTIETPALMPVVNPHIRLIEPAELKNLGASILITNSYIISQDEYLRDVALDRGLHDLLGFRGPIMTDSGAFQLSLYGKIEVGPLEIIQFQQAIGADICVPLDIPTPPDAPRERAVSELKETEKRLSSAIDHKGDSLLAGPIQGSTYPDLRESAGQFVSKMDFDLYPIGGVVPLMEAYRFKDLVDVVAASKKGLGSGPPVHLFGAGHPMVFALAAALGCDLFDSAAYALYAKEGRYLTSGGTWKLEGLRYLPCSCDVCRKYTPQELGESEDKVRLLALHNLHVTFEEIRLVKQHISEGSLWELLEARSRSHPRMMDALLGITAHREWLERLDSATKSTLFYLGPESARRPEMTRYASKIGRIQLEGRVLITDIKRSELEGEDSQFDHVLNFKPPFGAYPPELAETYPLNAEIPLQTDPVAIEVALANTKTLMETNSRAQFSIKLKSGPDVESRLVGED